MSSLHLLLLFYFTQNISIYFIVLTEGIKKSVDFNQINGLNQYILIL